MALAVAITAVSGAAGAQATQKQLIGGWTVTSVVNEDAGQKLEPYAARIRWAICRSMQTVIIRFN
jgi:hypothetical protein